MLLKEVIEQVKTQKTGDLFSLRTYITINYPNTVKAIRRIDEEINRRKRRKGFNLVEIESKKHGIRYYVRYSYNGKTLPTKFNTHTGDIIKAEQFALKNKKRLVESYLSRKDGRMFSFLEKFFDSDYDDLKHFDERGRRERKLIIINRFIPYLKSKNISCFHQITEKTLITFQESLRDGLLSDGKKITHQTVNGYMKAVKKIFTFMARKQIIEEDIAEKVKRLPVRQNEVKIRGCYDLDKLNGVFNKKWKDELSMLLCMIIYTTGMRNSEIKRICLDDIRVIDGYRFLSVKMSKTVSGIRLVPIHDILYKKLKTLRLKSKDGSLFGILQKRQFTKANSELAGILNVSDEELEQENITFYSGRHFWKTLMNAEGLGEDIEEIFMGHKVVSNVAKLYNHKDKMGRVRLAEKTKKLMEILDRCFFI